MLFDRHRPRLRMDVDQRYAAYAHRTRERTRDAHERSASNINASVTRTACDTVSGADTHAAVPTLNTLHACPFARHAHNGTHGLRILQRTGIRVPFTLGGRPLRNALAHRFAHDGAGPERTFTRRRKPQRKTFTRGDKIALKTRYCRIGLRRFWAPCDVLVRCETDRRIQCRRETRTDEWTGGLAQDEFLCHLDTIMKPSR